MELRAPTFPTAISSQITALHLIVSPQKYPHTRYLLHIHGRGLTGPNPVVFPAVRTGSTLCYSSAAVCVLYNCVDAICLCPQIVVVCTALVHCMPCSVLARPGPRPVRHSRSCLP